MLTLLIIREVQNKTHLTPIRVTIIKKSTNNKYWKGCGEKGILCTVGGSVQFNQFSSVQFSRSVVSDSATPWTAAHQAFLTITNSRSLFKLMSTESMMPSSHLILCHPLLFLPLSLSQDQGLFKWVNSSYQVAKVLAFQLQHQSFQWIFRTNFL